MTRRVSLIKPQRSHRLGITSSDLASYTAKVTLDGKPLLDCYSLKLELDADGLTRATLGMYVMTDIDVEALVALDVTDMRPRVA